MTAWTPPPSAVSSNPAQFVPNNWEPDVVQAGVTNEPVEAISPVSDEPMQASKERSETERLDPIGTRFKLVSGTEVEIMPLRLRQFLKFLRILTSGASEIWGNMQLNTEDVNAFMRDLAGLALFAIPEAEDQTVDFLKSIVQPADLPEGRDRPTSDRRMQMWNDLSQELENPDLDDALSLIQAIIEAEAADLMALGKRLKKMFETVRRSLPESVVLPTAS